MSWQATAWVSTVEAGGPSGKLLLYALANYADEHGRCWPSDSRLMADTEMGERTIRDWKRKLEDAGLLTVARRRGTGGTFQADEIRLAMAASAKKAAPAVVQPPANEAGGEVATTGECRRDHRQLTPPPPASDSNPPTPPYKAEPSKEPSEEPDERGGRDERKKAEVRGWALLKDWPGFAGMPKEPALKFWLALTADEQDEAERKFKPWLALLKAQRKSHVPAPSSYFGQKLFAEVPEPTAADKPSVVDAPVFGPVWGAIRLRLLLTVAPIDGPRPSAFMAAELQRDDEKGEQARRTRRAMHGWPQVNAMHDRATNTRKGVSVTAELADRLKPLMVPVMVGSPDYDAWRELHQSRGWPWIPDPGAQPVVYFPARGPEALKAFEQAIRDEGNDDDGGTRQQAAE